MRPKKFILATCTLIMAGVAAAAPVECLDIERDDPWVSTAVAFGTCDSEDLLAGPDGDLIEIYDKDVPLFHALQEKAVGAVSGINNRVILYRARSGELVTVATTTSNRVYKQLFRWDQAALHAWSRLKYAAQGLMEPRKAIQDIRLLQPLAD